ncbi:hypothetical protein BC831DRAFT_509632 [Entophlyctis helioformis]|nr:hypothetical protein BC831DRAFT_509632 [Entophlyctis helioformis]
MAVQVEFGSSLGPPGDFDEVSFKNAVVLALRQSFGIVGTAVTVDVLHYNDADRKAWIRTPAETSTMVASAIALYADYNGASCRMSVLQSSPFLFALSAGRLSIASTEATDFIPTASALQQVQQ